ncbi:hypothetical protein [Azospirillum sp. BE72]|uniref:hypothetical protein n=1 Tax=Azospirillum sp. BE72 TaxID=2817776 RepID=UPI002858EFCA|nr:hypothetical protein [Azospirillum sp. BE72]MDR6775604.1 hypothetical protein [Azospirillum sp. BE72]
MRRFGAGTAGRKGRSAGRSVASLLVVWVTMVALVIYQMPAFAGAAQAMPMPMAASAAMAEVGAPCDGMGQTTDQGMAGIAAAPDRGMPCCDTSSPDTGMSVDHSCPLMGGCFSMCASIAPLVSGVLVTERVAEHVLPFDDVGTPHSISPLRRPPKHL